MTTIPAHVSAILKQWQRKDDGIAQRFRTSFHDENDPKVKPIELELVLYPASGECRPLFPVRTLESAAALHACRTMGALLEVLMGIGIETGPRFMAVSIPSGIMAEGTSPEAATDALGHALLKAATVLGRTMPHERVQVLVRSTTDPAFGWVPWLGADKLVPLDTPWPPKFCQCGHSESEHECEQFAVDATRCNEDGCECQVFVDVAVYGKAEPE